MDQDLVKKITQQVLNALSSKGETSAFSSANKPQPQLLKDKKILLICSNLDNKKFMDSLDKLIPQIKSEASKLSLIIPSESGYFLDPAIRNKVGEVIYCDARTSFKEVIKSYEGVILPLFSLGQLSKLSLGIDDEWSLQLVFEFLNTGLSVWILRDFIETPPRLSSKVDNYIKELSNLGVNILDFKSMNLTPRDKPKYSALTLDKEPSTSTCAIYGKTKPDCTISQGECSYCGYCAEHQKDKVDNIISAGADRISKATGSDFNREVASTIDHTSLKADATRDQIIQLCDEAKKYSFASVCVNPSNVKLAAECLKGTPVKVCTVVGFPLGATTSMAKSMETRDAIANGAAEIDMVINVGALKAGQYDLVKKDIEQVVEAAQGYIVKVILETALLTDDEKIKACQLAKESGADFVKTSTGFGPAGATVHDIELMRKTVGKYMGVKASGGIRDFETAQKMIQAGATRIGASASVAIVKGEKPAGSSKY